MSVKRVFFGVLQKIMVICCAIFFGFANAFSANLPSGYTELEYIESTGTQYIDTGIYGTEHHGMEIKYSYPTLSGTYSGRLCGGRTGAGAENAFAYIATSDGTLNASSTFYMSSNNGTAVTLTPLDTGIHMASINFFNNQKSYFDGQEIQTGGKTTSYVHQFTTNLFRAYNGTSGWTTPARARIYFCKITDSGALVQHFVPAKRNSDNVLGMYDLVSGQFFTNSGTGEFTAGPVVPETPIKIATTAYNTARFSPVQTDLDSAVATIREIVTNTINQTKAITDLQTKKQTRPDEQCPLGVKCLLVEDNNNVPHWYQIEEFNIGLGGETFNLSDGRQVATKLKITTTSLVADTEFKFGISAAGDFYVDWGDGTAPEPIIRPSVASAVELYPHTYTTAGVKTIKIGGLATAYSTASSVPAVSFYAGTPALIASLDGSIGAIFPTLGTANGKQPRFYYSFRGCSKIKTLPDTLFNGVTGNASSMFLGTFYSCSGLTSVPRDLFSGITGNNSSLFYRTFRGNTKLNNLPYGLFRGVSGSGTSTFSQTFYGCTSLTSIPSDLFGGSTGGASAFASTFVNATKLQTIPENLFRNVTSAATSMFNSTFSGCTALTGYIPASAFAGLTANGHPYGTTMMNDMFKDVTQLATECPTPTSQVSTGYEEYWGNFVACQ